MNSEATADPFICEDCGHESWHPRDKAEGYCNRCHWWTGDPNLGPARRNETGIKPYDAMVWAQRMWAEAAKRGA